MKRLPAVLLAAFLAFVVLARNVNSGNVDWSATTAKVKQSIVRLEVPIDIPNEQSGVIEHYHRVCSGFVINSDKEYVESANHCWAPGLTVDGKFAYPVFYDEKQDLLILRVENLNKPALHPNMNDLIEGTPIAAYGYARGSHKGTLRIGYISAVDMEMDELSGTWLVNSTPYIGGMSGGPIYDINGNVVGIVEMSNETEGIGRDIKLLLKVTGQYWGK